MLFTDNPINSANQDALKREPFVKQLAKAILSWQSSEPLVVGIYGQWGDGKSSVLHLLMERLKGEAILTMFDPWYFNSEEELIRSFFINIFGVISKNLPWHSKWKIRRGAQAFSKMLTSLPISVSYGGIALSMKDFENKGINPIQKAELVASLKEREKNDKRKIN